MSKKITNFFTNKLSKQQSSKLVTDAALISLSQSEDNDSSQHTNSRTNYTETNNMNTSLYNSNNGLNENNQIEEFKSNCNNNNNNNHNNNNNNDNNNNNNQISTIPLLQRNNELILSDNFSTTNNALAFNNIQSPTVLQFVGSSHVHIGTSVIYNTNVDTTEGNLKSIKNSPKIKKTRNIDAMMKCNDLLQNDTMNIISEHLGAEWKFVFRQLDYSEGTIERVLEENHGRIKEVIYQLLLDFSRNDDRATLGYISSILWDTKHKDVVRRLKEYWKCKKKMESDEKCDE